MSAPVRASLNLQPLLPVAAPTAHNTTSPRSLLRRHTRRLVLASLAAVLVVNAWLASRALYRAWQLRGYEREQAEAVSRTEQVITNAGLAADNAVAAAMDSAAAMSSAASAAKHTANAAGQAAAAAVGVATSVAAGVAAAVGSAAGALNGSAAAKAAPGPRVASANFEGNSTAGGVGAAGATAAAGHPHHQVAELPSLPDTAPTSNDSCAQALGIPKVALLFLTYGDLAHEAAWRLWFDSAAGLVPSQAAQEACLPGKGGVALRTACAPAAHASGPLDRQHLFSVHVHAPPSVTGYPAGSIWQERLVSRRVNTSWGDISLVEAARNLLWEAFKDPLNQRFVLVSESDVPLYDPLTLHQQLFAEGKSRVNACNHTGRMVWRWSKQMETEHLKVHHWRKSGQFFGLTRAHAAAVLRDREVFRSFESGCWSAWDSARNAWRDCFPDEHYIPTLLAVLGRENETECGSWGVAAQDWSAGGSHPKEFKRGETTAGILQALRDSRNCNSSAAFEDAQRLFVNVTSALGTRQEGACQQLRSAGAAKGFAHPMPGSCPLTARKFPAETAPAMLDLLHASCAPDGSSGSLNLLSAAYCQARQAERRQR